MKQILVLTLFQCIVSDFFTRASKNFHTGTNHFPVKTPFTGCHTDSFTKSSVIGTINCHCISIFFQKFFKLITKLLLNLFKCKYGDFYRRASKSFDSGANHFLLKRHLLGVIWILFFWKLSDGN